MLRGAKTLPRIIAFPAVICAAVGTILFKPDPVIVLFIIVGVILILIGYPNKSFAIYLKYAFFSSSVANAPDCCKSIISTA